MRYGSRGSPNTIKGVITGTRKPWVTLIADQFSTLNSNGDGQEWRMAQSESSSAASFGAEDR